VSITTEVAFCIDVLEQALAKHGRPQIFNTIRAASHAAFAEVAPANKTKRFFIAPATNTGERASVTTARLAMEIQMADSVYKVIELVGTSTDSWEKAAKAAVDRAAKTLRDLRVAEVTSQDLVITDGKVEAYRVKVKVSFKFEGTS
jgi:dodecin